MRNMRAASAASDGLAENLAVDDDDGVGAKHDILRTLSRDRQRLLARQSLGAVFCRFSRQRIFGNVRRLDFESDAGVAQQFLTARRSGGEHEHGNLF